MPAPRAHTVHIAFRISAALSERLARLAGTLSTPWHDMNRSEIARAALERGIEALERETEASRGARPIEAEAPGAPASERPGEDEPPSAPPGERRDA